MKFNGKIYQLSHIEKAIAKAHETLNRIFPRLVINLMYQHCDSSGYWFTFQLINDSRTQTYCVRPDEII